MKSIKELLKKSKVPINQENLKQVYEQQHDRGERMKYISIDKYEEDTLVFTKDATQHLGYIQYDEQMKKQVFQPVVHVATVYDDPCLFELYKELHERNR